jgi:hypothetical protein
MDGISHLSTVYNPPACVCPCTAQCLRFGFEAVMTIVLGGYQ